MTPEKAINIADEVVKIYSGRSLTDIQRLILQESFSGKGYEEMTGYDPQHFKNEGSVLWKLLSEALGEKVSKKSFKGALEKRLQSSQFELSPPEPAIYTSEKWVGRSPLIEKLLDKFQKNTRILWLTGLSGIGKTTLGECLAANAWENGPSFQWIHFEITESQLSDFATGAREILSQLGEKDLNSETINDPKWLSDRLLTKLQENCYWLQIDALEKLIEINEFIDENWLIFFKNCLTANHFASRLFLTSQVLPNAMICWQDDYSNVWSEHKLKGLDTEESEQYFIKNGILVDESNQNFLNNISQIYEGHPLVLQVITKEIVQDYQGNVVKYWEHNKAEFEQVSRELNSHRLTETQYNEVLTRRVRERVKKSLEQLPETAIALLCRSSVYRRPVPKSFWLGLINEYSFKEQNEAYRILGDRALIEKEKNLIRLHNLVRDIAYDWLREDEVIWKVAEVKAAELWLSEYQPKENTENLEKVRGYLEAFFHYSLIGSWENAWKIVSTKLNTLNEENIYEQLGIWGYYKEVADIMKTLIGNISARVDAICYLLLGNVVYQVQNNQQAAISYFQTCLQVAHNSNEYDIEGRVLVNIGNFYRLQNNRDLAIDFLEKSLKINRKIGNKLWEAVGLSFMAIIFQDTGDYQKAKKYLINSSSSEQVCVYCKIEEERRRQKPCHRKKREE